MRINQLGTRFLAALLSLVVLANCESCKKGNSQSKSDLEIRFEPATLKRNVEAAVNLIFTNNTGKTIHSDDVMLEISCGELKKTQLLTDTLDAGCGEIKLGNREIKQGEVVSKIQPDGGDLPEDLKCIATAAGKYLGEATLKVED